MSKKPKETTSAPFLVGKRLYLRAPEPEDAALFQRAISDPFTRQWLLNRFPISFKQEIEFIERMNPPGQPPTQTIFSIVIKKNHQLIGNMGLFRINWLDRKAETAALIISDKYRSKGYGVEAKELLLEYAFNTLGLHRIESCAMADNIRSLAYLRKSGYVEEGVQREAIFKNGRWTDLICFSILEEEWRRRHH